MSSLKAWLSHPAAPALGTLLVALPTLALGFSGDDFVHLHLLEGYPRGEASVDGLGLPDLFRFVDPVRDGDPPPWSPWWASEGIRLAFWRPLSSLLAWLDFQLFGRNPLGWHAHSVFWAVACTAAATSVLRRVLDGDAAIWASWVFALEDGHWVPTAWLANRNALVAATFTFLALRAHLAWQSGQRGAAALVALCFGLGLAAGELALGGLGYALAWSLAHRKPGALAPWLAVLLPWAIAYKLQGYGSAHSGFYIDPVSEPLRWLGVAWWHVPSLAGASFGGTSTDLFTWSGAGVFLPTAIGLAWMWVAVRLVTRSREQRTPTERAWLSWMPLGALVALLPVASTWPFDRLLVVADLGTAAVLGLCFQHQAGRWLSKLFLGILAGVHLWGAPISWWYLTWGAGDLLEPHPSLTPQGDGTVLLLNSSDPNVSWFVPTHLGERWDVLSTVAADHTLTRPRADTLCLTPHGGQWLTAPFEQLWVHPHDRPQVGEALVRDRLTARVTASDGAGRPTQVCFTPNEPLDQITVVTWGAEGLTDVDLPEVGGQQTLTWSEGPTGL